MRRTCIELQIYSGSSKKRQIVFFILVFASKVSTNLLVANQSPNFCTQIVWAPLAVPKIEAGVNWDTVTDFFNYPLAECLHF